MDEFGARKEIEHAYTIMEHGSSAMRQLKPYDETKRLVAVVDQLIRETAEGVV